MPVSKVVLFHCEPAAGQVLVHKLAGHGITVTLAPTVEEAERLVSGPDHCVLILDNGSGNNAAKTRALAKKLYTEGRVPFIRIAGASGIEGADEVGTGIWKKNTDIGDLATLVNSVIQLD